MIKLEAQWQQQTALQHAGRDGARVADRAQQDRVVLLKALQVGVGQRLAITKVAPGAEVVFRRFDIVAHRLEDLQGLRGDLDANTVTINNREFHRMNPFISPSGQ